MTAKRSRDCGEPHDLADPRSLVMGELHCDGVNAVGNLGILTCAACGCAYAIPATKEIVRR